MTQTFCDTSSRFRIWVSSQATSLFPANPRKSLLSHSWLKSHFHWFGIWGSLAGRADDKPRGTPKNDVAVACFWAGAPEQSSGKNPDIFGTCLP